MLSGHDPERKGSVTPLKAKAMKTEKLSECWLTCGVKPPSHVGMPPNSLGEDVTYMTKEMNIFFKRKTL